MADFYTEMAAMAQDLLAPTASGGLGQGVVYLVRVAAGSSPNNPWEHAPAEKEIVKAVVRGIDARLVGTEYGSAVLLASDKEVITEVPSRSYAPVDSIEIDGVMHNIISVRPIPAAGIASAYKFIVRA